MVPRTEAPQVQATSTGIQMQPVRRTPALHCAAPLTWTTDLLALECRARLACTIAAHEPQRR